MAKGSSQHEFNNFDVQGHRGCRGLYPENSIPGFIHALELGVNTLEFDVVISADEKVIISHDPFMSADFCLTPEGNPIIDETDPSYNIYKLKYREIKKFDCGSKIFDRFPGQKKSKTHKPSLKDLVKQIKSLPDKEKYKEVRYNIEIKRKREWDGIYHPEYKRFADLVISTVEELGIKNRTTIQSFDIQTLQYLHFKYPEIALVYLIYNRNSPKYNIDTLGFYPAIYSPYHPLVDEELVSYCSDNKMLLIPWTVNEEVEMEKLIHAGVDGIITDYPDILLNLLQRKFPAVNH